MLQCKVKNYNMAGVVGSSWLWSVLPRTWLLWEVGNLLLALLPWIGFAYISRRFRRNTPSLQQIGDEDIEYARYLRRQAAPFPALLDALLVVAYFGIIFL